MRNTENLLIAGAVGQLEALHDPVAGGDTGCVGVVCHPHPLHEGSMHNKVVYMLARSLNQSGIASLRFNFRGVGASEGQYDEGNGEIDDALAALEWARRHYPGAGLMLAGFSFGAQVSLRAALRTPVVALVSIAPPVQHFASDFLPDPGCPWLLVQGMRDELVAAAEVESWASRLPVPPQQVYLKDTDHFFHGKLNQLREIICDFLDKELKE